MLEILHNLSNRMSLKWLGPICLITLLLTACSVNEVVDEPLVDGDLALLYDVEISSAGINFYVISSGCTKPSDFELVIMETAAPVLISIHRSKSDFCRARKYLMRIGLAFDNQGLDFSSGVIVSNPMFSAPDTLKKQKKPHRLGY